MITQEEHRKALAAVRKAAFAARVNDLNALRDAFGEGVEEIVQKSRAEKLSNRYTISYIPQVKNRFLPTFQIGSSGSIVKI